jgi:hypothetical protein
MNIELIFRQLVRDILRGHGSEPIELPPDAALQADAPAEVPASGDEVSIDCRRPGMDDVRLMLQAMMPALIATAHSMVIHATVSHSRRKIGLHPAIAAGR